MRPVEAQFEQGILRPLESLPLRPGERVRLIVMRQADPERWNLARLAAGGQGEDVDLATRGLGGWAGTLDAWDRR